MALRLASNKTIRLELGEGDWLEVRKDMSRRAFISIVVALSANRDLAAEEGIDVETATAFGQSLFEALVVGWSVQDENGKPVEATVENYQLLSSDSAPIIDAALAEHFSSLSPNQEESQKSEEPSV